MVGSLLPNTQCSRFSSFQGAINSWSIVKSDHDDESKRPISLCLSAIKESMFEGILYTHVTIGVAHINVRICTQSPRIDSNNSMVNRPYKGHTLFVTYFCSHLFPRSIKGGREDQGHLSTMNLERSFNACNHPLHALIV